MKAITIWQPWASLLAMGIKQYETRSWATSYRGPIAIHAAKKNVIDTMLIPEQVKDEMKKRIGAMAGAKWENLPTGAVIATAKLVNVWHIVQYGYWNGAPLRSDDLVDPETAAIYLGQDDKYGHGIYVPLKDVAAALGKGSACSAIAPPPNDPLTLEELRENRCW